MLPFPTVLPGAWSVVRLDERGFSRFTERHFDKPFDARFSDLMVATAQAVLTDLGGCYADTESDEISVLFDPEEFPIGPVPEGVARNMETPSGPAGVVRRLLRSSSFGSRPGVIADGRLYASDG